MRRLSSVLMFAMLGGAFCLALYLYNCAMNTRRPFMLSDSTNIIHAAGEKTVLDSPLAGTWYDGDKDRLAAELDGYFANADAAPLDNVHALIMPHAGYRYSGPAAAYGAKQVKGKHFSRVIVMGPSHRVPMENLGAVTNVTHCATPLGEIPIDTDFVAALKKHPYFRSVPGADEAEHSVQIELPLLQYALGEFKLVPIVIGNLDLDTTRAMAEILLGLIDETTLVVASSDFTHHGTNYGFSPFEDNVQARIEELDMGAWEFIKKKDLPGFAGYVKKTGATICGRCPIGVLLAMLPDGSTAHLLKYDTSGRIMGDTDNSVSYLCAAFTGAWEKGVQAEAAVHEPPSLTEEDGASLLTLARATLEYHLNNAKMPTVEEFGIEITPGMKQVMGAFVTLTEHGRLRGCIGEIFPRRPLYKAVMEHAVNAGVNDHRFKPVLKSDLPLLHFEISALTPPSPVDSYQDIVIGKHGMFMEKDERRAVYLPQVAPEQGWDIDETLTHLSQKAGLSPDAWKRGASFTVFEAIVFHEKEE